MEGTRLGKIETCFIYVHRGLNLKPRVQECSMVVLSPLPTLSCHTHPAGAQPWAPSSIFILSFAFFDNSLLLSLALLLR